MMAKKFPQHLSAPFQVLWFESDVLGMVAGCFILAMIFGGIFWGLLFLLPWLYSRAKKKYPRGFLRHCLYFLGLINFRGYPAFFEQRFLE